MLRLLIRALFAPLRALAALLRIALVGRRAVRGPLRALRTVRRVGRALR